MAINEPQLYLLAYDIADPDRLVQVHRVCRRWGIPIQYSVFLVPLTPVGMGALIATLDGIIDRHFDDIRIYPLPSRVEVTQYGRQGLPEGIEIVGGRLGGDKIAALAACRLHPKRSARAATRAR